MQWVYKIRVSGFWDGSAPVTDACLQDPASVCLKTVPITKLDYRRHYSKKVEIAEAPCERYNAL